MVSYQGTAPNLAYNPNPDYTGPDSFTFKANDGTVDSNTATVSINVQDLGPCADNLPISSVTASGNEVGNVPSNVLDGSLIQDGPVTELVNLLPLIRIN